MITEREFNEGIVERTKKARVASGLTQAQMAEVLGLTVAAYQNYERTPGRRSATPLPYYLVRTFCLVARVSPDWLIWNNGEEPQTAYQKARERAAS